MVDLVENLHCDVTKGDSLENNSPLSYAFKYNRVEMAKYLIMNGAKMNYIRT